MFLERKPDVFHKELVVYLREERGIVCDQSTVSRTLKRFGLRGPNFGIKERRMRNTVAGGQFQEASLGQS